MSFELQKMLDHLQAELFFYLADGALKNKLIERYLEEDDAHAEILDVEHNASLRIKLVAGSAAKTFDCRLEANDFEYQISFSARDFTGDEIVELLEQLQPHCPSPRTTEASGANSIVRKKQGRGLLGISATAATLGLSHRALKALIPCRETRIAEKDGHKIIKEYYWDQQLVTRLACLWLKHRQGHGYNSEDLSFIAQSCCDNDRDWARDCITGFLQQCKLGDTLSK